MTTETDVRAHRFKVGAIACAIVSDGSFAYHEPGPLFFANAPQAARDEALRAHGIDADAWHEYISPYSALLIDTGQQHVLVDTGAGGFAPTNGQLLDNLGAEGVDLAAIDTVVLTHAHPDHIGGNLDAEQRPAFPEARNVLWRRAPLAPPRGSRRPLRHAHAVLLSAAMSSAVSSRRNDWLAVLRSQAP